MCSDQSVPSLTAWQEQERNPNGEICIFAYWVEQGASNLSGTNDGGLMYSTGPEQSCQLGELNDFHNQWY